VQLPQCFGEFWMLLAKLIQIQRLTTLDSV
jgi:hypothetical protein